MLVQLFLFFFFACFVGIEGNILKCPNTSFFLSTSLRCELCDPLKNLVPNYSNSGAFKYATSCKCRMGYIWDISPTTSIKDCYNRWPKSCEYKSCRKCEDGLVPTSDQNQCVKCGNSTLGIDNKLFDCICPKNHRISEITTDVGSLPEKKCVLCPQNSFLAVSKYECTICPSRSMYYTPNYGCKCNSSMGYQDAGGTGMGKTCLPIKDSSHINANFPSDKANLVYFNIEDNGARLRNVEVHSDLFKRYFLTAASYCYHYSSEKQSKYCQTLGNLCVLQVFDNNRQACAVFEKIKGVRNTMVNEDKGWVSTLPFIKYEGSTTSILQSKINIQTQESLNNLFPLQLASYSLNGSLIGFEPLTNHFLYCNGLLGIRQTGSTNNINWLQFGYSYKEIYSCDIQSIMNKDLIFYELFLVDNSNPPRRYQIPVRIVNYKNKNNIFVNKNSVPADILDDELSNRFFLFDFQTGKTNRDANPKYIRYAKEISLQVKLSESSSDYLETPVLTISYVDKISAEIESLLFQVEYVSNTSSFWSTMVALFSIICVFVFCFTIIEYFNWQRRNTREDSQNFSDLESILRFVFFMASSFSTASFWFLFAVTGYFFLFFKLQKSTYKMLPEDNNQSSEYYSFKVCVTIAFFCKLLSILKTIYRQTSTEIFFIDWEKPRAKIMDDDSIQSQEAPISIWRTILVANEWNEMQAVRKTSMEFTTIAVLFLLSGCKLEYLSTPQPNVNDLTPGPKNIYLSFASVAFLWLLISYLQIFWKWAVQERYFTEPKETQFVDLCTMAKISCLLLDERFHGYYLHCRSPYPFADGSMIEITDQLKQEEAGLMSSRGLQGGPSDLQTFQIMVTQSWRKKYDKIYSTLLCQRPLNQPHISGRLGIQTTGKVNKKKVASKKLVKASKKLNSFLKGFIDNNHENFRWKLHSVQPGLTRILNIPPEMSSKKRSLFLPDPQYSFTKVLFLGIESDLIVFNILTFTLFDIILQNTLAAGALAYAFDKFLAFIRNYFGKKNVAEKTLVDDRFLI